MDDYSSNISSDLESSSETDISHSGFSFDEISSLQSQTNHQEHIDNGIAFMMDVTYGSNDNRSHSNITPINNPNVNQHKTSNNHNVFSIDDKAILSASSTSASASNSTFTMPAVAIFGLENNMKNNKNKNINNNVLILNQNPINESIYSSFSPNTNEIPSSPLLDSINSINPDTSLLLPTIRREDLLNKNIDNNIINNNIPSSTIEINNTVNIVNRNTMLRPINEFTNINGEGGSVVSVTDSAFDIELNNNSTNINIKRIDFLKELPREIAIRILKYFENHLQIENIMQLSTYHYFLCQEQSLWKAMYLKNFSSNSDSEKLKYLLSLPDGPPAKLCLPFKKSNNQNEKTTRMISQEANNILSSSIEIFNDKDFAKSLDNLNKSIHKNSLNLLHNMGFPVVDWLSLYQMNYIVSKNWDSCSYVKTVTSAHLDSVYCVQFSKNMLISGSRDRTIKIWERRPIRKPPINLSTQESVEDNNEIDFIQTGYQMENRVSNSANSTSEVMTNILESIITQSVADNNALAISRQNAQRLEIENNDNNMTPTNSRIPNNPSNNSSNHPSPFRRLSLQWTLLTSKYGFGNHGNHSNSAQNSDNESESENNEDNLRIPLSSSIENEQRSKSTSSISNSNKKPYISNNKDINMVSDEQSSSLPNAAGSASNNNKNKLSSMTTSIIKGGKSLLRMKGSNKSSINPSNGSTRTNNNSIDTSSLETYMSASSSVHVAMDNGAVNDRTSNTCTSTFMKRSSSTLSDEQSFDLNDECLCDCESVNSNKFKKVYNGYYINDLNDDKDVDKQLVFQEAIENSLSKLTDMEFIIDESNYIGSENNLIGRSNNNGPITTRRDSAVLPSALSKGQLHSKETSKSPIIDHIPILESEPLYEYVCTKTLTGHSGSVLCLQYNSKFMVTGSSDSTIKIWDIVTGEMLRTLTGHTSPVLDVQFNDEVIISCSKDCTIKIWDITDGSLLRTLRGHNAAVNAVHMFKGEIASASGDGIVKLWDWRTGICIKDFVGHSRGLACVQYNGDVIVSGSNDKTIKIWNAHTGEELRTLVGHNELVRTLHLDTRTIIVEPKKENIENDDNEVISNINGPITRIQRIVISGSYDQSIKVWDIDTGELLREITKAHSSWVFHVGCDGRRIISASQDKTIIELNLTDPIKENIRLNNYRKQRLEDYKNAIKYIIKKKLKEKQNNNNFNDEVNKVKYYKSSTCKKCFIKNENKVKNHSNNKVDLVSNNQIHDINLVKSNLNQVEINDNIGRNTVSRIVIGGINLIN